MSDRSQPRAAQHRPAGERSVAWYMSALCLALVLPLLTALGLSSLYFAAKERDHLQADMIEINRQLVLALDRQIQGQAGRLKSLATSASLWSDNIDQFRREAEALSKVERGVHLILHRPDGEILFSVAGPEAPVLTGLALEPRSFTKDPGVSRLLPATGFADGAFLITVGERSDAGTPYHLTARIPVVRLVELIATVRLAQHHFASIVDPDGLIMARSEDSERLFGRRIPGFDSRPDTSGIYRVVNAQGVAVAGMIGRSAISGLSVTTGVTEQALLAPLRRSLYLLGAVTCIMVSVAAAVAWVIARRMGIAIRSVTEAARSLGAGHVVAPPATDIREANVVGAAIAAASSSLHEQARALAAHQRILEARVAERTQELGEKTLLLEATLHQMDQGLLATDAAGHIVLHNDRLCEMFDLPRALLEQRPHVSRLVELQSERGDFVTIPEDAALMLQPPADLTTRIHERSRTNGTFIEIRTVPLATGGLVRTYTDITLRKRAEQQLSHLASHDALTGLTNRSFFRSQVAKMIGDGDGPQIWALLYMDLDRFKQVNDSHGHPTGDIVLRRVGRRIHAAMDIGDLAARLGGDEFAVFRKVASREEARQFAMRLVADISAPYRLDIGNVTIGVSIGISFAPDHGRDVNVLIMRADRALYWAKRGGRGDIEFYEPAREQGAAGKEALAGAAGASGTHG